MCVSKYFHISRASCLYLVLDAAVERSYISVIFAFLHQPCPLSSKIQIISTLWKRDRVLQLLTSQVFFCPAAPLGYLDPSKLCYYGSPTQNEAGTGRPNSFIECFYNFTIRLNLNAANGLLYVCPVHAETGRWQHFLDK